MKRFCIYYNTPYGESEYWVYAESKYAARQLFRTDFLQGNLDSETDGTIRRIVEMD